MTLDVLAIGFTGTAASLQPLVLGCPGIVDDDGAPVTAGSTTVLSRAIARTITPLLRPTGETFTRSWSTWLGESRADRAWRCADLVRAGVTVTLGSDRPIAPFDPRVVMDGARLRRPFDRPDLVPVQPSQALTAAEPLTGYTAAPAHTAGEPRFGRVAPGFLADLTVWDDDPLACSAEDLPHLSIAVTVVDGVIRHRAAA